MKRIAAILLLSLSGMAGFGQASVVSHTGQFIVGFASQDVPGSYVGMSPANAGKVKLEPALVAVSCERIKRTLLSALGVSDRWRGKIYLALHRAAAGEEKIVVTSIRYGDGWNYQISLPELTDSNRLVRAVTQVLLLEMAVRQFPAQSAALPAWLAEGMPQYLLAVSDVELVLQPAEGPRGPLPLQRVSPREGPYRNPFAQTRERLRERLPLTLLQLSYPGTDGFPGEDSEFYRDTAVLFIHELLKLKNGGKCLFGMLTELHGDPDWRVAFLKAFKQHFPRVRDLEKWWALQSAYFAARDPNQLWTRAESIAKLEEVLRTPLEVRLGSNEPALYTDVTLQAIIKGWTLDRQMPVLREKISLLQQLQLRVAIELRPLVRQYTEVLAVYLDKMDPAAAKKRVNRTGRQPLVTRLPKQPRSPDENDPFVKQILAQLGVLDARCDAWRFARGKVSDTAPGFSP